MQDFCHYVSNITLKGYGLYRNPRKTEQLPHMRKTQFDLIGIGGENLTTHDHVCTDCIVKVIQFMYNRNPVSAYDTINAVNATLRTNIIIQDGIVFNSQEEA